MVSLPLIRLLGLQPCPLLVKPPTLIGATVGIQVDAACDGLVDAPQLPLAMPEPPWVVVFLAVAGERQHLDADVYADNLAGTAGIGQLPLAYRLIQAII